MYRIYRKGRRVKARAHSNYIRPDYVEVWKAARTQAEREGVSLSRFVCHALYKFMTGKNAPREL